MTGTVLRVLVVMVLGCILVAGVIAMSGCGTMVDYRVWRNLDR